VNPIYRAVVIGCGRIGSSFSSELREPGVHSHCQAYVEHPRTRLAGVCDISPERAAEAGRLWRAESGTDAVTLCARLQPEIVSVCTPDPTHHGLTAALLQEAAPRALLIEKPLALRRHEAESLLARAREKQCLVAVHYSRRFSPAFRAIASELREGRHGRPLLGRFVYGKGLLHNGSHAIDLMRFWLGEPVRVAGGPAAWGPEGDPSESADMWFGDGCRVRLEAFDERVATLFELDFLTEHSRWTFAHGGREWTFHRVADDASLRGYRRYLPTGRERTDALFARPMARTLGEAVDNVVAALDGEAALWCTGEDGLEALRWVEAIRGGAR
jgi:predicted dehydrogenase